MIVLPEEKTSKELGITGNHVCPICMAQSTISFVDIGWVSCPMVNGNGICVGCCVDLQGAANSGDFENHPFFEDFVDLVQITGKTPSKLQRICIAHQLEISLQLLYEPRYADDEQIRSFINYLEQLSTD